APVTAVWRRGIRNRLRDAPGVTTWGPVFRGGREVVRGRSRRTYGDGHDRAPDGRCSPAARRTGRPPGLQAGPAGGKRRGSTRVQALLERDPLPPAALRAGGGHRFGRRPPALPRPVLR